MNFLLTINDENRSMISCIYVGITNEESSYVIVLKQILDNQGKFRHEV